ncbi:hypothetical protein DM860_013449 [Cuscuta australis]|uniref:Uncharacterized protein n=1 Tax=Cuscuta australis TaxID=267555 RepID=A0A328D2F7_9ASTE|nr:hypothetical protein DM860_013449 [Cuscuta australis]
MASLSSRHLKSPFRALTTNPTSGSINGEFPAALACKPNVSGREFRVSIAKKFELNCLKHIGMDATVPVPIGAPAQCMDMEGKAPTEQWEPKEPSFSTVLMNFSDELNPYDAMSTPLYQTATFKQPSAT